MKFIHIFSAAILLSSYTAYSAPFGEKTNCRFEKVGEQNIYKGWSYCTAKVNNNEVYEINQYVPASLSPRTTISNFVFTSLGYTYLSCEAEVPFSHKEDIMKEVCDYKPEANFLASPLYDGTAYEAKLKVAKQGRDYDGYIVSHEFTVNGVNYGPSVPLIAVRTATLFNITYKVTDNDGYTGTKSKTLIVNPLNDPCREGTSSC